MIGDSNDSHDPLSAQYDPRLTGIPRGDYLAMKGHGPKPQPERARVNIAPRSDPWFDRKSGMTCSTCIWFVEKSKERIGTADSDVNPLKVIGRCRRHAPSMNGFVPVYPVDWCGDHRIDENKI